MKVICTHDNASTFIDGVKFEKHEDGMISEEISDEKAEEFLAVPHIFKAHKHPEKKAAPVKTQEPAPTQAPVATPPAAPAAEAPPAKGVDEPNF